MFCKSAKVAKKIAAEGTVLLKNDNHLLPLSSNDKISVFGCAQYNFLMAGGGSGFVESSVKTNLLESLVDNDKLSVNNSLAEKYLQFVSQLKSERKATQLHNIAMPDYPYEEMELLDSEVEEAAEASSVALFVVSRISEEGRDRTLTPGDYYLSDKEEKLIQQIDKYFENIIVILNTCGVIDLEWTEYYQVKSILYTGLSGAMGAQAVSEILSGDICPSGHLTDTFAKSYNDYPSSKNFGSFVEGYETKVGDENQFKYWGFIPSYKPMPIGSTYQRPVNNHFPVLYEEGRYVGYRYFSSFNVAPRYCFGYGLSYTDFEFSYINYELLENEVSLQVSVKNIGKIPGKATVQVYVSKNDSTVDREKKVLVGFAKTEEINPNSQDKVRISIPFRNLYYFSIEDNCYHLEAGTYTFYISQNVEQDDDHFTIDFDEKIEAKSVELTNSSLLKAVMTRESKLEDLPYHNLQKGEGFEVAGKPGPEPETPIEVDQEFDANVSLKDLYNRSITIEEFVNRLSLMQKLSLIIGTGMKSKTSLFGGLSSYVDGAAGHTPYLKTANIPTIVLADGPAGVHITKPTIVYPSASVLANSWSTDLALTFGLSVGLDAKLLGVDIWLGPSFNIHRNPLCGRNFEYFSEDPLLSGLMAASVVNGVQSRGVGVCIKHFVANNQETNRFEYSDSQIDIRTLREIYLRAFEIVVKNAEPWSLMTSYNLLNGVRTTTDSKLLTDLLRKEWNFNGLIVTDWEGDVTETVEALQAGTDICMPGFSGQMKYVLDNIENGRLSEDVINSRVKKVLELIMKTQAFKNTLTSK